jgi:pentatricopeptide repeat protein
MMCAACSPALLSPLACVPALLPIVRAADPAGPPPVCLPHTHITQGCIETGDVETALKVFEQMQEAQMGPNAHTHHQLVDAGVVAGGCLCSAGLCVVGCAVRAVQCCAVLCCVPHAALASQAAGRQCALLILSHAFLLCTLSSFLVRPQVMCRA